MDVEQGVSAREVSVESMKYCSPFSSAHKRSLLSEWILSISVATINSASASSVAFVPESAADRNARSHAFRSLQQNVRGGKNAVGKNRKKLLPSHLRIFV